MIDYHALYSAMEDTPLANWLNTLANQLNSSWENSKHGDLDKWRQAVECLPFVSPSTVDLKAPVVRIGKRNDCDDSTRSTIEDLLRRLHPWRKGPFSVFDIYLDTEWRSDFKWNRFVEHAQPFQGRNVLDVGCGNGYHCWRIAGEQARLVIGIDPTLVYVMQFHAIARFLKNTPTYVLPLRMNDVPYNIQCFDTVLSMGVLYHCKSPAAHLRTLFGCLREGAELILETLIIDGKAGEILMPDGRYAQMRNVNQIPSCGTLENWLKDCGYTNIRLIDVTRTTIEEQRATDWMRFNSLSDFLQPDNPTRTIENLPAPKRALFLANKG